MDLFIWITAITVSIDAMAAGFALALRGALNRQNILQIGAITLMLCLPCALFGELLGNWIGPQVNLFGGILLITVGLRNFSECFCKEIELSLIKKSDTDAITVGFAVGLDACVANLSLSLMGNHSLIIPIVFAVMHILAVGIGYFCMSFLKKSHALDLLAAILLTAIGVYKTVGVFLP